MGAISHQALIAVGLTLLHELCHDADSRNAGHDANFYQFYHDRADALAYAVHATAVFLTLARIDKLLPTFPAKSSDPAALAERDLEEQAESVAPPTAPARPRLARRATPSPPPPFEQLAFTFASDHDTRSV